MPAVSVIIPVFNVEPYIARCVRSLFGQTLQDLEFVFVDDCSLDHSIDVMWKILEEYPKRKNQVRYIRQSVNSGLAKARVTGVSHATSDYIVHCDSDDEVALDAYQKMYEKAVADDLDIVTCDFKILGMGKPRVQVQACAPGREVADILAGKIWSNVWCRLFKRELWNDLIVPKGDMWEDMVFTVQAISRSHRSGYIHEPLYLYYRREGSISYKEGLQFAMSRWESVRGNAQLIEAYLQAHPSVRWDEADMVSFKYRSRAQLLPYIQKKDCFKKWRDTFPEVDNVLFWTKGISLDIKIWFILVHLRLYHPCKVVSQRIRRMICK